MPASQPATLLNKSCRASEGSPARLPGQTSIYLEAYSLNVTCPASLSKKIAAAHCGLPEKKSARRLPRPQQGRFTPLEHRGTRLADWHQSCAVDPPRSQCGSPLGEASGQWQTLRHQPLCWRFPVGGHLRVLYWPNGLFKHLQKG